MTIIISIVLFLIFIFLSVIHFYWAFGGRWGSQAVFPTKDNNIKPQMPGVVATLIVAFGLLVIGLFILRKGSFLNFQIPTWLDRYGLWVIAVIFSIRTIGDFNYAGFFKKIKHTKFALNDTKYYTPLCLMISILLFILIANK